MTKPDTIEPDSAASGRMAIGRKVVVGLLAGGIGALCGYAAVKAFGKHEGLGWADLVSLSIALSLFMLGIVQIVASRTSKRIRSYSGKILPAIQRQFVTQGLVLLLAGVMLAMPILVPRLMKGLNPWVLYGGLCLLFAAQTWLNLRAWKTADEFYRRALMETSAVSFWLLQGALFLWAAAERFGLAPALSTWDCITILMTVYLILSGIVARRLGVEG